MTVEYCRRATFVVGAVICALMAPAARSQTTPKLDYAIRWNAPADPATLTIVLTATGLPVAAESTVCRLDDWSQWASAPFPYVRNLRINGHANELDGMGRLVVPPKLVADQRLDVRYDLVVYQQGSIEHQQRHLLPFHRDQHVFAFVANTLVQIVVDAAPLVAEITVRVEAAPDQQVFTGWAGFTTGPQVGVAPGTFPEGNGIFAIGKSVGHVVASADGCVVEVAQFSAGPDVTTAVADVARTVIPSFARGTGRAPRSPMRIFVEGSRGGGVHADLGVVVDSPGVLPLPDETIDLLAHELFHHWLGSHLVGDDSLVWFSEGFTDYLAIWHSTASGLITPDRFAERILGIEREARSRSSLGHVAFAQPGIEWRDGDGPNEVMAYRGGALLAFVVDAELRRRSHQSVNALLAELFASAPRKYQLMHVRDALTKLGLGDVYERSVAGTELPAAFPLLLTLGYDETVEEAGLTYLGIEARSDAAPGADTADLVPAIVTAIDPAGPAAKVGIVPGDRIVGYGTRRGNPPQLGPDAPARYQFGLSVIPSGATSVTLDLVRDGKAMQIDIAPVVVVGGRRASLRWNPERRTGFFDLPTH